MRRRDKKVYYAQLLHRAFGVDRAGSINVISDARRNIEDIGQLGKQILTRIRLEADIVEQCYRFRPIVVHQKRRHAPDLWNTK